MSSDAPITWEELKSAIRDLVKGGLDVTHQVADLLGIQTVSSHPRTSAPAPQTSAPQAAVETPAVVPSFTVRARRGVLVSPFSPEEFSFRNNVESPLNHDRKIRGISQ
jgi:hypothetical protein